jgi:hypothetical protein
MSDADPTQGDGAQRVTLSEATSAVMDELTDCRGKLESIRRHFGKAENPDGGGPEHELTDEDEGEARKIARHVAARLEACAGALRNASDPSGPPFE